MVEMNTQGDVFSTAEVPKADSAAHTAIVMPTQEHPLEESSKELDRLFWELVDAEEAKGEDTQDTDFPA